jgi:hypothetical protein
LTFLSLNDIIKSTHAIDAKGGRLPIGIPGRLQIGMHGRLRRYPHCNELARLNLDYISVSLDDYRKSRPTGETRVYDGPVAHDIQAESPITEFARVIAGRSAVMASGGIKTCMDAEGAIKMGADLVAVGRAVVVDPEWLSKVRSKSEASILAGLPKDELEIAKGLSIPPRMVEYLLSRPGWIPRL